MGKKNYLYIFIFSDAFPEIFGRVLQRLEDPANIQETFGIECKNSVNLVYPGLSLRKFENFAMGMAKYVDSSDNRGFWTTLSDLNSDTFQKLLSELCRPLLKSGHELDPESVIVSLHGIYVITEMLYREFATNHQGNNNKLDVFFTFYFYFLQKFLNV